MLKKARSFREKLKKGTLGRSSSSSKPFQANTTVSASGVLQIPRGSTGVNGSNKTVNKLVEALKPVEAPVAVVRQETQTDNPNVQKLISEKKKVQQAMKFITFAVEKNNMVLLPGSATIALETTFELITFITSLLSAEEPSSELTIRLVATQNCLAELMEWADQVMLMSSKAQIDTSYAKNVIKGIETSVNDLTAYACEKVKHLQVRPTSLNTMTLPTKARRKKSQTTSDSVKRNSMPDVPLTPREQTILRETSLGAFDNPLAVERHDTTPTTPTDIHVDFDMNESEPPPKPYLPPNFDLQRALSRSMSVESQAPNLPPKRKHTLTKSTTGSSLDSVDGVFPPDGFVSAADSGLSLNGVNYSEMSGTCRLSQGSLDERLSQASVHSGSSGVSAGHSSLQSQPYSPANRVLTVPSTLPCQVVPLASDEDLSPIQTAGGVDYSTSRMSALTANDLSLRIDQLALGLRSGVRQQNSPKAMVLPPRNRARLGSDYDNIDGEDFGSENRGRINSQLLTAGNNVMHQSFAGIPSIGISPVQDSQMATSNVKPPTGRSSLQVSRQNSASQIVDVTYRHLNIPDAPPLPPKRKHVESYMHVFGTEVQLSEFNPVENEHSRQYYLDMHERHMTELFHSQSAILKLERVDLSPHLQLETEAKDEEEIMDSQNLSSEADSSWNDQSQRSSMISTADSSENELSPPNHLDEVDVREYLIRESTAAAQNTSTGKLSTPNGSKKQSKAISDLKGGTVDALIVYATYVGKHDFMYQEAFLTTYRTFVTPEDLIDKLLYRYSKFSHKNDVVKKRLSRNAFSLLVRVVDELTPSELTEKISRRLLNLVTELVREGELSLAKIMRKKILEKCDPTQRPVEDLQIMAPKSPNRDLTLLDFKSHELAEQMTLLDNDFYQRLELPELLIWSDDQNEERCPNLVQFTAHFNKMSWWCRTVILRPNDAALRERLFVKFVHTLKHLRKHNNFNSLLALLSALDSAPISRLDWPKQERDIIQEYSSLINSSSSFKAYRMALADAEPPCIPYIGMILMDMTFIRIGNTPKLIDGKINFQMRWHLFNVLECLRRFRKPLYPFKKDQRILSFFNNFDDFNSSDDEMWKRSKEIKPTSTR